MVREKGANPKWFCAFEEEMVAPWSVTVIHSCSEGLIAAFFELRVTRLLRLDIATSDWVRLVIDVGD